MRQFPIIAKRSLEIHFLLALMAGLMSSAHADVEGAELEEHRKQYQEAHANFVKTQDYGKDYRLSIESAHQLILKLLQYWITLPEDAVDEPDIRREIRAVYKKTAGSSLTEKYNQAKSFMSRAVWPLLATKEPNQEQASFIAELVKPQIGVRINDKAVKRGKPTEPFGWNVQAAYALALIRSGKAKQGHEEIDLLYAKAGINSKVNPEGKLDYGPDAGEGRYRNYKDYLQMCEVLRALQALILDDRIVAAKHLEMAKKLRETFSAEAIPLVSEVEQFLNMKTE